MVDCPTEDVPFREGAFGGAGDGIQRARLPFTRTVWFPVRLSPPFPIPKGKPATPLAGCSWLRLFLLSGKTLTATWGRVKGVGLVHLSRMLHAIHSARILR